MPSVHPVKHSGHVFLLLPLQLYGLELGYVPMAGPAVGLSADVSRFSRLLVLHLHGVSAETAAAAQFSMGLPPSLVFLAISGLSTTIFEVRPMHRRHASSVKCFTARRHGFTASDRFCSDTAHFRKASCSMTTRRLTPFKALLR